MRIIDQLRRYVELLSIPFVEKRKIFESRFYLSNKELENLIEKNNFKSLEYIYFNKKNFHEILYNSEKLIQMKEENLKSFSSLFYFDLLIKDDPNTVNYIFSQETISDVSEKYKEIKNVPKKIIYFKILFDYIETYIGFNEDDTNKENLERISLAIENNKFYKEYKDDITEKSLDILVMELIIKLINKYINNNKNRNNKNKDFVDEIIEDFELEKVYITKNMYNIFNNFLLEDRNIREKCFITNIKDMINIKKINFYYLVIKILKNSILTYQYDFLINTRNLIIGEIKKNLYSFVLLIIEDKNTSLKQKEKIDFIIKALTDLDYYINKYEKMKFIISDERFKYTFPLMQVLNDIKIKDFDFNNENYIKNLLSEWTSIEQKIKDKKFKKIHKSNMIKLYEYFNEEKNKQILLNIFSEEEINNFKNIDINKDNLEDEVESIEVECNSNLDEAVIEEEALVEDGVQSNFNEISEGHYEKKIKNDDSSTIMIEKINLNSFQAIETEASEVNNDNIFPNENQYNMFKCSNEYKVIEHSKTLEEANPDKITYGYYHNCLNLSGGHYLIWGTKLKATLYNVLFEKKLDIIFYQRPYYMFELPNKEENKNGKITVIICSKNKLESLTINTQNYIYFITTISREYNISYTSIYPKDNHYIVNGEKGMFELSEKYKFQKKYEFNKYYKNGINITDNKYIFTSNAKLPNGKDELIVYDSNTNSILKQINNYGFDFSSYCSNGICSINLETIKSINYKRNIVLCACETKDKKNGFLVLNMNLEKDNNEFFEEFFYETEGFEPCCFTQILNVENNNSINDEIYNEENINIDYTEYFLVGGFDPDKRIGCIKLYKLVYDKDTNKVKIKFLVDIITENNDDFSGFDMNISCITQSKITGNFIINCWDDSVHLFKPQNLKFFL